MVWLSLLTLVWLVVAVFTLSAHRQGGERLARRWLSRLYAVSLVPLSALLVGAVLVGVQLALADGGTWAGAVGHARPYALGLAPVINLVVLDIVLRRQQGDAHRARRISRGVRAGSPVPMPSRAGDLGVHEAFTFEGTPARSR